MDNERGVTLIITFMTTSLMLAIVLSLSLMLFHEIRLISNIGSSVSAFYASESGAEKMLYFDRKLVAHGVARGLCNICNTCNSNDCQNCTLTHLDEENAGCNVATCGNCGVTFTSYFDDKSYKVSASVTPDPANLSASIFNIDAKGYYRDSVRAVNLNLVE